MIEHYRTFVEPSFLFLLSLFPFPFELGLARSRRINRALASPVHDSTAITRELEVRFMEHYVFEIAEAVVSRNS